jgi:dynein heavy chain 2
MVVFNLFSQVQNMEKDLEKIPHFSLLAAAFVTYLSAAPEDIRRRAMDQWKSMLGIRHFELKRFLSSEREMLHWRSGIGKIDNVVLII